MFEVAAVAAAELDGGSSFSSTSVWAQSGTAFSSPVSVVVASSVQVIPSTSSSSILSSSSSSSVVVVDVVDVNSISSSNGVPF